MSLLKVSGINLREEGNLVLKDISFTQEEFQKVVIAGETGSGKSTLLQTVAGLAQPQTGEVLLEDEKVIGPAEKLVPGHAQIAYLSQQFELPQFLRVEQVLQYANTLSTEEAEKLYEVCRINHLLKRRTNQLSGGERQRIALARLLSSWPKLLLLDEPFSNLDTAHKSILKSVIRDIGDRMEITCTLVSHDPLDTLSWADEILVIKDGEIIQRGTPKQIYKQPVDEYTAALFGKYNLLNKAQTSSLAQSLDLELTAESVIIRPESFKLEMDARKALEAVVEDVQYYGSYYEILVAISGGSLTVRTVEGDFAKGDKVRLSVAPADIVLLQK
ncbi:ABC transporter ATP-binding protein [Pontibacter harenae]|uniref:ABC transporter ATP-binding protein n=1 Tax=Pontibacter harenae TaxID=2894083 RepID=UPI001E2ED478|nr:ABC transporter ATP-binding protein [Pontibacter harenae]MCC9168556.1 ABC transporter ATP-binding protein [Pontibacter harenae]